MKRKIWAILAVITVCSICLTGIVSAAKEGYGFTIGGTCTVDPDINGVVAAGEWDTDSYKDFLYDGWTMSTSFFMDKWSSTLNSVISELWAVEFLSDTTNDPGDYFKMSVDRTMTGGFSDTPLGGTAPTETCFQITITGSGTVTMQIGTGTAWAAYADPVSGTDYIVGTSVSASPSSATAHRCYELYLDKGVYGGVLAMGYLNNARLEVYDASTGKTLMWPPYSSADVPDTYGAGTTGSVVPEGLTIGIMLAVASVAVVVSARYFRKPKI
jgi:hypothetical protein